MTDNDKTSDLTVNVRDLLRAPGARKHIERKAVVTGITTPVASISEDEPVTVVADADNVVEGILVSGTITAASRQSCVRCLTESAGTTTVEVRELFALRPAEAGDADEDEGYALVPPDQLALGTMVRDALALALPPTPLCRPDCAGLCPRCGADRNTTDCGHDTEPEDPRWGPLAALLSDRAEGERPGQDDD
jgi:uncharacterized protein